MIPRKDKVDVNKPASFALPPKAVAKEDRTTTPYMTKYERARILGARALQIRYEELERMKKEGLKQS